jgi:hypothetical protein
MGQVRQDEVQIKLEIDGSQSRTELDNLTRKAQVLQEGMKGLKKGSEEYVAANKELSQVQGRMAELRAEIGLTSLTSAQLKAMSGQLNRELANLTPNTESFLNKAQELANVDARLAQVRAEAKGVKDELGNAGGGIGEFIKKAAGFAGIQLGVQAVVSGLRQLGSESIDAAVKGSDAIADMEKSLNVTTEEAHALRLALQGIDTRTSQEKLEDIAIAAGQLGIAKDQAVAFTTSVDQAVVALGDEFTGGVEEVTKSLGGLQKLFKDTADVSPADAITKIGSAVNALGADGTATGPVIADFAARIGQLGNLAPQIGQTLGLGAAFQELGLSAEISSGGLSNILLTASKDTAGFGKQIGLTSKEFSNLINTDPNEVILRLANSLKGASNTQIIATLDGLNVKSQEATKVISLLANKTEMVAAKQALASTEYTKGTSLLDEFAKKNNNAAAEVAKAEKSFVQYRQELGERLLPLYLRLLQLTGLVVDVLRALPGFVAENKTAFGLLAVALAVYNAEQVKTQYNTLKTLALQKLVALGVLTEVEGKYSLVTANGALTAAQEGLNVAMEANPIGIIITLLALLAFGLKQLYDRSELFRGAVDSLFGALQPLGAILNGLLAQVAPLVTQLGRFFGSIGGGKAVLELFGYLMGVAVVLPLKLVVVQVQGAVDAFTGFLDVGKRVANFFGTEFEVDPNGSFDKLAKNLESNGKSILNTVLGRDASAVAEQVNFSQIEVYKSVLGRQQDFLDQGKAQQQKAAAELKEEAAKNNLEELKAKEADIKARLALVQAGSLQELLLKKQEVLVKRDIDLLGEKKTEGDRKVIRAEAQRDIHQLNEEYAKKQKEAAEKHAKEQADVEKRIADLRAAQIPDETERKIAQLNAVAEREKAVAKGTAQQIAEQRQLIEEKRVADEIEISRVGTQKAGLAELEVQKLNNSLIKNEFDRKDAEIKTAHEEALLKLNASDVNYAARVKAINDKTAQDIAANDRARVANYQEILDEIAALDDDSEDTRDEMRRSRAGKSAEELAKIDAEQLAKKLFRLDKSEEMAMRKLEADHDAGLISDEEYAEKKRAIHENFLAKKDKLNSDYELSEQERWKADVAEKLGYMTRAVDMAAELFKISSDNQLKKQDADKKKRLASLEAEFKAGTITKEAYEAAKSTIETNYDAKTRTIKKEAAEKEKVANIAKAVIQTAVNVVEAFPNPYLMAAAAALGAFQVGTIVATKIPEFEKGGFFGGAGRAVKQSARQVWQDVKHYATGGRINPRAGVADVGQRHSGGGIRMVDGATGEHLGEWERGEAYMILSRDTYANNKHLVDELIDTSLYRGGAPVRRQAGFYEDGGTFAATAGASAAAPTRVDNQELMQLLRETRDAVRALPDRQYIAWGQDDTANIEGALNERAEDRAQGEVK